MNEPDMIRTLTDVADDQTSVLCDGLFGSRRSLHKRLAEYSVFSHADLYQSLRRLPYQELVGCSNRLASLIRENVQHPVHDADILIDAPPIHREVEFRVDVYDSQSDAWQALRDISPIVNAMSDTSFDDCVKRVRIFVSEPLIQPLRGLPNLEQLVQQAVGS